MTTAEIIAAAREIVWNYQNRNVIPDHLTWPKLVEKHGMNIAAELLRLHDELSEAKAALAEQVTHCERCDGQGDIIRNVHMRDDGVFDCDTLPCPDCKPARDLLAKWQAKP